MLKIFKYLKSSIIAIIMIIGLLFLQAYLDLRLPDYTSKIVNVGIESGGIEKALCTKIKESDLNKLTLFMTEDDKNYVLKYYQYDSTYKGEKLVKLVGKYDESKLENIFVKPMLTVLYIDTNKSTGKKNVNFNIPSGVDIYQALKYMPVANKEKLLQNINDKLNKMPDAIIKQAGISFVKKEYKSIGIDTDKLQMNYIFRVGAIMIVISLISLLDGVLVVLIGSRMAAKLAQTLRAKVFKKVVGYSATEVKKYGQSSLITRTTNDIQQVQSVIVFLMRVVFYAPIIGIGGVMKAAAANGSMTWIIGLAVGSISVVVVTLFTIVMPKFNLVQKLIDKLNLVTREILSGLQVVRAFHNEKHEEERFSKANGDLTKLNIFVNKAMSFMMPLMMLIMNLICLLIVYKGAYGVNAGNMQVGDIMAYIQYTMQIIMAFLMISAMSIMLPRANVSAKRINEVLKDHSSIKESDNPQAFEANKKGLVEFQNVCFKYPDATDNVIENINLICKPGEVTAFIGSTGSGKSTVINLIPRFYDVTGGAILVDGVNIKDCSLHDLRDRIGFVPQKGVLFTGSIQDNIRYGNNKISTAAINKSLEVAQASDFVKELDGGLNYLISEGGSNVSGGQKQRLSIARAIAKDPEILIFDDSFSALDFKTDAKLRSELSKITKDKTVLIVAQRISTIINASNIVVLNEGKVVGIGTHKDLMKTCKVYQEIALSQLSKEELENA